MLNENSKALPRHPAFLATAMQHPQPTFAHLKPKTPETDDIARHCVIVEVALNHAPQPLPDLCQRLMHSLPKFILYPFQFGEESLTDGLAQHKELAVLPGLSTDVGEPQKVESLRPALPPVASDLRQQNARTQSGVFYPDVIPARTFASAPASRGGTAPHPLDVGTPTPRHPHSGPR